MSEKSARRVLMSVLSEVVTISEVAFMFRVTKPTVRWHCEVGHFTWRYSRGGVILIDRASVERYYGLLFRELPCEVIEAIVR